LVGIGLNGDARIQVKGGKHCFALKIPAIILFILSILTDRLILT
jgi:hypothetical protein